MKKLTTEEFIKKAKLVHGKLYSYQSAEYQTTHKKILIKCKKHGYFEQTPGSHLRGRGCPTCSGTQKLNKEEFIKRGKKKYGNKFDYSKVVYKNNRSKVKIICPLHGEFLQTPLKHLFNQNGCRKCGYDQVSKKQTLTTKDFIKNAKKIHGNKYDYTKTEYVNQRGKVIIGCKKHGEFKIMAGNHTNKLLMRGCPTCGHLKQIESQKMPLREWKRRANEIHNNFYDYSKVSYSKIVEHVDIICPIHGLFNQNGSTHIYGVGCPKCKLKGEGRVAEYLIKKNIVFRQHKIKNKLYDFYLPEKNILIERDGEQHYMNINFHGKSKTSILKKVRKNDIYKKRIAKNNGYILCRLPFWLSEKDEKKEIDNILAGNPSYPDVPDLKQAETKPLPN